MSVKRKRQSLLGVLCLAVVVCFIVPFIGDQTRYVNVYAQTHLGKVHLGKVSLNQEAAGGGSPVEIVIDSIGMDFTWMYEYDNTFNYGASVTATLGEGHAPTNRDARLLVRWPGYDDTVTAHSPISEDSGKIGLVLENLDTYMGANDTLNVTMHKITIDWTEGDSTGQWQPDVSSWDTATTATAWTTAGGDFSATRETFGSYADSVVISRTVHSVGDTVWFYVSGATMSDMATNNYGLLIKYSTIVDEGADGSTICYFYSDDVVGTEHRLPIFKVYLTE